MSVHKYLPSGQFTTVTISIAAAVGLIYAATYITQQKQSESSNLQTENIPTQTASQGDWATSLSAVQAQSGVIAPTSTTDTANALRQSVQGSNLTDTISKTLLINLTDAQSQGLGADATTQAQIVQQAVDQINTTRQTPAHTQNDLVIVDDTTSALHTYGNALISTITKDSGNNGNATIAALGLATDKNDPSQLDVLKRIEANYRLQASDVVRLPVPRSLAGLHLQLINTLVQIADTYPDMEQLIADPLRGLSALQRYQALSGAAWNVFISTAQILVKDGIIFNKDEPGDAWSSIASSQVTPPQTQQQ